MLDSENRCQKSCLSYQDRLSLLGVWAADGGEVGVGVFLLGDRDRWSEAEGLEGLLDEVVSDAVERRVDKLQCATSVQIPKRHQRHVRHVGSVHPADPVDSVPRAAPEVGTTLSLLPMEAEGGELVHVAAVDLGQGVSPQGRGLHQLLLPAGGAPGLQLLLDTPQDLLVMR